MEIKKTATAGSLQSNDCLVTVMPSEEIEIKIDSPVAFQFEDQMREAVEKTLGELDIKKGSIKVEDKGALDCTISARVESAIRRANA